MRALVVNCSKPHYNLGAAKLADWLREEGWTVTKFDGDPGLFGMGYDLVCLSVIFSWHALIAREIAWRVQGQADIWCGGPGMAALQNWWKKETGLTATMGIDPRFERQRGNYRMTFASRGCPVGCWFCIVPRIEGKEFTLDWDFQPRPILCDNNLSALPIEFQEHILRRYADSGIPLADANSGFEPRAFDADTYDRWRPALKGPWRFAFDEQKEVADVEKMMMILAGESAKRKRVYVLIGNEPMESCYDRVLRVIGWGGEPYCQPVLDLNYLGGPIRARHDWTDQRVRDFARYVNRYNWRSFPLAEYLPRQNEPKPFAEYAFAQQEAPR